MKNLLAEDLRQLKDSMANDPFLKNWAWNPANWSHMRSIPRELFESLINSLDYTSNGYVTWEQLGQGNKDIAKAIITNIDNWYLFVFSGTNFPNEIVHVHEDNAFFVNHKKECLACEQKVPENFQITMSLLKLHESIK